MAYLHGFSDEEAERLRAQARHLAPYILADRPLEGAERILEIGAGVGGQTELLCSLYPKASITAVELDERNYAALDAWRASRPDLAARVTVLRGDASALPAAVPLHDAAYVCWVLEHCPEPVAVLRGVRAKLLPGARLQVQEVNNQSQRIHPPPSPTLARYVEAFNELQRRFGGDPDVGARLGQLLLEAGFERIETSALLLQFDDRTPEERANMFDYLARLFRSGEAALVEAGLATSATGDAAEEELCRLGRTPGAIFHYTIIRALARA